MVQVVNKFDREPDDADVAVCCCCGKKIDLNFEDYCTVGDGEVVCTGCKDSVTTCERCGIELLKDEARTGRDGTCLCEYCWDDLYTTC